MRCDFFSETLRISTSMTVILPQGTEHQIGMRGQAQGEPPVLYLLHGLTDDDTIWSRRTSIERYAADLGLAVVMPQVAHSFYADEAHGLPYWSFLTQELPTLVHRFFRVSDHREDTFVAGLSMGGYGAMKWALREPWRFSYAASLSGALAMDGTARDGDPWVTSTLQRIFDGRPVAGSDNDLLHLLTRADPAALPPLYVACGADDFLFDDSVRFVDAARASGVDIESVVDVGDHEWGYWDHHIQQVLSRLPLRRSSALSQPGGDPLLDADEQ